ncbi:MAG: hypothetical protein AABY53_09915 [Bdellovibrionota bacterium]
MRKFLIFIICLLSFSVAFAEDKATATESSTCDADFVESYLAKRNCVINSDQEACTRFGLLASIAKDPPVRAAAGAGGAAALVAARLYKIKLGAPDVQARFTAFNDRVSLVLDKSYKYQKVYDDIYDRATRKILGDPLPSQKNLNYAQRIAALRLKPNNPTADIARLALPELAQYVKNNPDPLTKALNQNILYSYSDSLRLFNSEEYAKALEKYFPKEYKLLKLDLEKYHSLGNRASDLMEVLDKTADPAERAYIRKQYDGLKQSQAAQELILFNKAKSSKLALAEVVADLGVKPPETNPVVRINNERILKILNSRATVIKNSAIAKTAGKGATVGGAVVGAGSLGVNMAKNSADKDQLDSCQSQLSLSSEEVKLFKGEWKLFSPAKVANGNSDICSDLKFVNPEENIKQLLENFNSIPPGSCNILKNESTEIDAMFGKGELNIDNASCSKFEADNVKLTGTGLNQIFEYTENGSTVRAKFDGVKNWPIFSEAEVFKGSQLKPDGYLTEDLKRSFPTPTAVENEDRHFDVQDIRTYSAKCTKDSAKNTSVCGLFKAAMLARVKSTMFQKTCIDGSLKAGTTSNTEPVKDVKTDQ